MIGQLAEDKNLWVGPVVLGDERERLPVRQGHHCSPRVQGHRIWEWEDPTSKVVPANTVPQRDLSTLEYLGLSLAARFRQLHANGIGYLTQSDAGSARNHPCGPQAA